DRGCTEAIEQTSPLDGDDLADVRPFEVGQELRGGEEQHHYRYEGRNAGSHELGNIAELRDGTGDDSVDDADRGEEQHHDYGDVVHQRRVEDASALPAQRGVCGQDGEDEQSEEEDRGDPGPDHSPLLGGLELHVRQRLCIDRGFGGLERRNSLGDDQLDDHGDRQCQHDRRRCREEVVRQRVDIVAWVDRVGGRGGQTGEDSIGAGGDQPYAAGSADGDIGDDGTDDRAATDCPVGDHRQGDHDGESGITGDLSSHRGDRDREGDVARIDL